MLLYLVALCLVLLLLWKRYMVKDKVLKIPSGNPSDSGWFQEVESPAPGEAPLVLGEQADVLQEHQGYRAGALQRSGGTPVWDTLEPERCLHLHKRH